ncbi:hypothetical protein [Actinomyces trachealis]|uniref:hypothetical protein n=1 Tax=Actinomyces trachealis TaxID=2763540 RepID=UPI001892C74C|nr:hypothetical protein [Actinomyces trachealis]
MRRLTTTIAASALCAVSVFGLAACGSEKPASDKKSPSMEQTMKTDNKTSDSKNKDKMSDGKTSDSKNKDKMSDGKTSDSKNKNKK